MAVDHRDHEGAPSRSRAGSPKEDRRPNAVVSRLDRVSGRTTLSAMSGASLSQDALYTDAERQRLPTSATLPECGALGFAHMGKTRFSLSTEPETVAPPPPSPRPRPCRQPETASPHTSPLRPDSARHADLGRRGKEPRSRWVTRRDISSGSRPRSKDMMNRCD